MRHQVPMEYTGGRQIIGFGRAMPSFWLNDGPTASEPQHVAFTARNRAEVDAFYQAAVTAGGRDNGKPGLRPQYHETYYGAFVLDPDGNNIDAPVRSKQATFRRSFLFSKATAPLRNPSASRSTTHRLLAWSRWRPLPSGPARGLVLW